MFHPFGFTHVVNHVAELVLREAYMRDKQSNGVGVAEGLIRIKDPMPHW